MRYLILPLLLAVTFASWSPVRSDEPSEEEAAAALTKLGAKINGGNPAQTLARPVRGVLFPKKGCDVTDADLAYLKALKNLEYVYVINQKKVTGEGLKYLAGLKKLDTIDLMDTPVKSEHLAHLKDLKQLHKLGLWRTAVDDAGMVHLQRLTNLEHLYLDRTDVGDKGIEAIGPHQSLCNVTWSGSRVTEKGEALMKKQWSRLGLQPLRGD